MIKIKRKVKGLSYSQKWFYDNISFIDSLKIVSYLQTNYRRRKLFFIREKFHTIRIDLTKSIDEIYSDFSKETKYEIRRAERDGVNVIYNYNEKNFLEIYNAFAESKGLNKITIDKLNSFKDHLLISASISNNEISSVHLYLCDGEITRLLYSARNTDCRLKNSEIGIANRYLHYRDMIFFKNLNYKTYDLGGIAKSDNDNLIGINKFKKSFGGNIVEMYHYYSFPYYFLLKISKKVG